MLEPVGAIEGRMQLDGATDVVGGNLFIVAFVPPVTVNVLLSVMTQLVAAPVLASTWHTTGWKAAGGQVS